MRGKRRWQARKRQARRPPAHHTSKKEPDHDGTPALQDPPIEEALCEFRFEPGQEWDLTIPGRLYTELRAAYPGKPRQQMFTGVALDTGQGAPPRLTFQHGLARVQLVTEEGTRIVGVGPDVLSVHMLRPYQDAANPEKSGWEEFRSRIDEALAAYWRIGEPLGVQRVSIRYINKIVVRAETVEPRRYILCAPGDIKGLPDRLSSFVGRVEYTYDDGVPLVVTHAAADAPEGHVAFLLDIDVIWHGEEAIDRDAAVAKAEDLHEREGAVFEILITDETRRLFDAD